MGFAPIGLEKSRLLGNEMKLHPHFEISNTTPVSALSQSITLILKLQNFFLFFLVRGVVTNAAIADIATVNFKTDSTVAMTCPISNYAIFDLQRFYYCNL